MYLISLNDSYALISESRYFGRWTRYMYLTSPIDSFRCIEIIQIHFPYGTGRACYDLNDIT